MNGTSDTTMETTGAATGVSPLIPKTRPFYWFSAPRAVGKPLHLYGAQLLLLLPGCPFCSDLGSRHSVCPNEGWPHWPSNQRAQHAIAAIETIIRRRGP